MQWYEQSKEIKKVIIGEGITSVGAGAFYRCSEITEVTLPSTLTTIGENAFGNCFGMQNIYVPKGMLERFKQDANLAEHVYDIVEKDDVQATQSTDVLIKKVTRCWL